MSQRRAMRVPESPRLAMLRRALCGAMVSRVITAKGKPDGVVLILENEDVPRVTIRADGGRLVVEIEEGSAL